MKEGPKLWFEMLHLIRSRRAAAKVMRRAVKYQDRQLFLAAHELFAISADRTIELHDRLHNWFDEHDRVDD
jgi:hypothetical protein